MRQAVRDERYQISAHANEEMSEDGLDLADVESVVLGGEIMRRLTHDPRGVRYEVGGTTVDGRRAVVVCRFLPSGALRVITAYVEKGQRR